MALTLAAKKLHALQHRRIFYDGDEEVKSVGSDLEEEEEDDDNILSNRETHEMKKLIN